MSIVSGADKIIKDLPNGYLGQLGLIFKEGKELSIGEWQKVALARAFYRDTPLLILDEPTSFLDPISEAEVFRNLRSFTPNRCTLIVSHRFSTVQMADKIVVLEEGKIVEQGSHQELLNQNQRYARMFNSSKI